MSDVSPFPAPFVLQWSETPELGELVVPRRQRLPDTRESITHKFNISGHEGYITVGLFEDRRPGEVFLKMAKEGVPSAGLWTRLASLRALPCNMAYPLRRWRQNLSAPGLNLSVRPEILQSAKLRHLCTTSFDGSGWSSHLPCRPLSFD